MLLEDLELIVNGIHLMTEDELEEYIKTSDPVRRAIAGYATHRLGKGKVSPSGAVFKPEMAKYMKRYQDVMSRRKVPVHLRKKYMPSKDIKTR